MRSHKAGDHWRRVYERQYPVKLDHLAFETVPGLGTGAIQFEGGITAVVGANGVGKSTLLSAVFASLTHEKGPLSALPLRIHTCQLTATMTVDQNHATRVTEYDAAGFPSGAEQADLSITLLNPGLQGAQLVERFASMADISAFLEAYGAADADEEALQRMSYVINREYSFCRTHEIDDYYAPAAVAEGGESAEVAVPTFPYFLVESGGARYGTETMGLGEAALHLTLWLLDRIPERSVLLIEEPETFVSPRSQAALMDVLAEASSQRGIWTVVTTHSPSVLSRVPSKHIWLLARTNDSVTLMPAPSDNQLHFTLGVLPRKSTVLLVEDRFAREFVRAWLSYCASDLIAEAEVLDVGLVGIQHALDAVPQLGPWFAMVGLFDGDQRASQERRLWPHSFLMSDEAPELLFQAQAHALVPALAERLRRDERDLRLALAALAGVDHHDWFEELRKHLEVAYERLMADIFACWYAVPENGTMADRALEEMRAAIAAARTRPLSWKG